MTETTAIEENLGLIISIAKKFKYSSREELDEYIHVGKIGFLKAYRRFDTGRNTQLSTYAWFYIRKEILQHIRFKRNAPKQLSSKFDSCIEPTDSFSEYLPATLSDEELWLLSLKMENYTLQEIVAKTKLSKGKIGYILKRAVDKIIKANEQKKNINGHRV